MLEEGPTGEAASSKRETTRERGERERSGGERGGGGWEARSTWGRRGGRLCEAAAAVRRVDAWASLALEIAGSEGEVHLANHLDASYW